LLNEGQLGITAASKDNGEPCPTDESVAGMTAWHFVLPGSAAQNVFDQLVVTFVAGGVEVERTYDTFHVVAGADLPTFDWGTFDHLTDAISTPDGKHAYVYTEGDEASAVVDAAAQLSGSEPATEFQLSHTCTGSGTSDGGDDGGTDSVQATTGSQDTGTDGTEVLGEVVTKPQQLPATGDSDASLAIIGTALVLVGGGILLIRRNVVSSS
jgi:LPXTG-motif cell wall-anchored protein